MKRPRHIVLLYSGLALLCAEAHAENWVSVQLLNGESLDELVARIHPCPLTSTDPELQKVIQQNHELLRPDGTFALVGPTALVTRDFLKQGTACREKNPPAPACTPGENAEDSERALDPRRNVASVHAGTVLASINATDFNGDALALGALPELTTELEILHRAGERTLVGAHAEIGSIGYSLPGGTSYPESSLSLIEGDLEAGVQLDRATQVLLGLGARQVDRVSFINSAQASLDLMWIPKLSLSAERDVYERGPYSVAVRVETDLFLPAQGAALTSLGAELGASLRREVMGAVSIELAGHADFQRQSFTDSTESITAYSVELGLQYRF